MYMHALKFFFLVVCTGLKKEMRAFWLVVEGQREISSIF